MTTDCRDCLNKIKISNKVTFHLEINPVAMSYLSTEYDHPYMNSTAQDSLFIACLQDVKTHRGMGVGGLETEWGGVCLST